LLYCLVKLT